MIYYIYIIYIYIYTETHTHTHTSEISETKKRSLVVHGLRVMCHKTVSYSFGSSQMKNS